jgi:hypothetical protein
MRRLINSGKNLASTLKPMAAGMWMGTRWSTLERVLGLRCVVWDG